MTRRDLLILKGSSKLSEAMHYVLSYFFDKSLDSLQSFRVLYVSVYNLFAACAYMHAFNYPAHEDKQALK